MPSVTQEPPTAPSCKKRRLDDNHHQPQLYSNLLTEFARPDANFPIISPQSATNSPRTIFVDTSLEYGTRSQHTSPLAHRKIIPLPSAKRQRMAVEIELGADGDPMQRSPSNSPSQKQRQHHHRPRSPSREELHDKTRPTDPSIHHQTTSSASLMSRCHICFRKPTKKADLDSFADCQGCGQRTCYVCIRECLGWGPPTEIPDNSRNQLAPATLKQEPSFTMLDADSVPIDESHQPLPALALPPALPSPTEEIEEGGWARGGRHRRMVCSRCCVEKGVDGEVVCLGCLPFVEG